LEYRVHKLDFDLLFGVVERHAAIRDEVLQLAVHPLTDAFPKICCT
jgi:hypothetical protein